VRYRLSGERKSIPVPMSLRPMHIEMLRELEQVMHKNKSAVVQTLVELAYKTHISKLANEPQEEDV